MYESARQGAVMRRKWLDSIRAGGGALSLALVPLLPGARVSPTSVCRDFAAKWPDLPPLAPINSGKKQLAFRSGESTAFIAKIKAPISWHELEGPCETCRCWPDAKNALRDHSSHLIVALTSEDAPVQRARALARVCSSILATCPQAPGVYWSAAPLVTPSATYQKLVNETPPHRTPTELWVDFRVAPGGDGKLRGYTAGMKAFGHMEFETNDATEGAETLRERLAGLAAYLLENGQVIWDGDKVGDTADAEKIRVVFSDSAFGREGKVMRLVYSPAKRKGWFR
ncbi:MAG TPA: DUF4261 domain-containing protein [Planctomycetia bacterium]|nr:DUF4261 domain-containing protein [Planctomycetia bacterium]